MAIYPVSVTGDSGTVELTGELEFIDPANQPAGPDVPFKSTVGNDVDVLELADGTPIIFGGNDSGGVVVSDGASNVLRVNDQGVSLAAEKVGFFVAAPVVRPTVPETTPAVQDVIDALVLLGLVEQTD